MAHLEVQALPVLELQDPLDQPEFLDRQEIKVFYLVLGKLKNLNYVYCQRCFE